MHNDNLHKSKYDFDVLTQHHEVLDPFVFLNDYGTRTIDFFIPEAVKALNTALLKYHYGITFWEFPDENLCPPIPSRADYIHHLHDLLRRSQIETDHKILDIGTGASCIYPILGQAIYQWNFVASDIVQNSIKNAQTILDKNNLNAHIELRLQKNEAHILEGIMSPSDRFNASMCNPPFFKSQEEAIEATKTKLKGLGKGYEETTRNFSGTSKELSYKGGEKAFLHTYLYESTFYKKQCFWFTSLVSNVTLVKSMQTSLKKLGATDVKIIDMIQGNKVSRVVAWTFLTPTEQSDWNTKK